ncbi:MAG TPA: cytochrome P450 [Allosphingosinicella sp.]
MAGDPYLDSLIRRAEEEGPVLRLADGAVGIFDPSLALEADVANSDGLKLPGSLSSLARKPVGPDDVTWREARALLIQRSRQLSAPPHLEALHRRMRALLGAESGRTLDLTALTVDLFSKSLLPLVIDGLPRRSAERLAAGQQLAFRRLSGAAGPRRGWAGRLSHMLDEAATGRAISKALKRRFENSAPALDDYAQAIVPLVGRVGLARSRYLLTTLLTAVAGPPGMVAACILFELVRNPGWRERIRSELKALDAGEIYAAAARKAPLTARFIKETMRLWPFPLVTHRIAYHDLEVAGTAIGERCPYDLSPYVMHRSERHWRNPELFDPDRWLAPAELPPLTAYVPFGFGPRSCVGASVGQAQLILFCQLAMVEFDFDLEPGRNPRMSLEGFAIPTDLVGMVRPRGG